MKLTRCNTTSCAPSTLGQLAARDAWLASPFAGFTALNPFLDFGRLFAAPSVAKLAADVFEDDTSFYARFEVPGVRKEDVKVEVADRHLTVSVGKRETTNEGESTSSISRRLALPETVAQDRITAQVEDGLLTVTLPKQDQPQPRQITIQ